MIAVFRTIFALLVLCSVAFAVLADPPKTEVKPELPQASVLPPKSLEGHAQKLPASTSDLKTEAKPELVDGDHAVVDSTGKPVQLPKNLEGQAQKLPANPTDDAHSRHKRGCKTVTYKKGGRTVSAQKC